jgi:K+-sensing histidine kinase KdpD
MTPTRGPIAWLGGTLIAIGAVILALAANAAIGVTHPFLVCYPTVLLSVWVGGPIASLVTTFLLASAATYFWLPPYGFAVSGESDAIALFVFIGVGIVISGLAVAGQGAPTPLAGLRRETDHSQKASDTGSDRLHAVADALRTSEVLIRVRKRADRCEHPDKERTISRRADKMRAQSSIWIPPSQRAACDTCGHPITPRDIAYEIAAAGYDICIDRACYQRLIAAVESGGLRLS